MWASLAAFFGASIVPLALRVLKALGFALVSYGAVALLFDQLETFINARVGGLTADLAGFLRLTGFITGLNMLLSAYAAVAALKATQTFLGIAGGE